MDPLFRRAFKLALGVHGLFVLGALLFALIQALSRKPEPLVFELVGAAPPSSETQPSDQPREDPLPPFEVRPTQPLKPLPEVPSEPPPKPSPRTPTPPATPAPAPARPAPNISYEEWSRNRNLPDRRQVVQRPSPSTKPVPQIDTAIRDTLRSAVSAVEVAGLQTDSVRDPDALLRYQVLLSKAIERVFVPQGQGLTATAHFFVDPAGRLYSPRISQPSGVAAFDQAVLRALNVARSPGPPPENRSFEFYLTFRSP